jgi:hypothetical protein
VTSRAWTSAGVLSVAAAALLAAQWYGPSRRVLLSPTRVVEASAPEDIARAWDAAGVRGRIAVQFARRLNAVAPGVDPAQSRYLEEALRRGVVRRVFHVVPDGAWPEVAANIGRMHGQRPTSLGFALFFDAGRVDVLPLSRFVSVAETALVVVEPSVFAPEERATILRHLEARDVRADLLTVIRGGPADRSTFAAAVARARP